MSLIHPDLNFNNCKNIKGNRATPKSDMNILKKKLRATKQQAKWALNVLILTLTIVKILGEKGNTKK